MRNSEKRWFRNERIVWHQIQMRPCFNCDAANKQSMDASCGANVSMQPLSLSRFLFRFDFAIIRLSDKYTRTKYVECTNCYYSWNWMRWTVNEYFVLNLRSFENCLLLAMVEQAKKLPRKSFRSSSNQFPSWQTVILFNSRFDTTSKLTKTHKNN